MRRVLVVDTSILCVLLDVPGKTVCGSQNNLWDKARVDSVLESEKEQGAFLVLPLAVIIETGNHIAHSQNAWECASAFCEIIKKSLDAESPWVSFSQQDVLWSKENLHTLANEWPEYAKSSFSIGDMTIKMVAEYYAEASCTVRILTGDQGLKAYEPSAEIPTPRRYRAQQG